jgi:hypothetical protein
MDMDSALVGLWARTNAQNRAEGLLVLPFNKQEYMISYPPDAKNGLFAKACLCNCAGKTFVQLQWLGTTKGTVPEDNRVYQFATYELSGQELRVLMLDTSVISKDTKTSVELIKAIEDNKDDPGLFREPMVFTKAKE